MQKQNDTQKPSVVVEGITYINEALVRDVVVDMKIRSRAKDAMGRPLIEIDAAAGGITIRSGD